MQILSCATYTAGKRNYCFSAKGNSFSITLIMAADRFWALCPKR